MQSIHEAGICINHFCNYLHMAILYNWYIYIYYVKIYNFFAPPSHPPIKPIYTYIYPVKICMYCMVGNKRQKFISQCVIWQHIHSMWNIEIDRHFNLMVVGMRIIKLNPHQIFWSMWSYGTSTKYIHICNYVQNQYT